MELALLIAPAVVPVSYARGVQAQLYQATDGHFSLHQGYNNNRDLRPFTFSNFLGQAKYDAKQKTLEFPAPFELRIRSPLDNWVEDLEQFFSRTNSFNLYGQMLELLETAAYETILPQGAYLQAQTLSPIILEKRNPFCNYHQQYAPHEIDWSQEIFQRLARKYEQFYGKPTDPAGMFRFLQAEKAVIKYGTTIMHGYKGRVELAGNPELLKFAAELSVGSFGPKGCGMLELL